MSPQEKIAKLLNIEERMVLAIDQRLSSITGKVGVVERILEEQEAIISDRMLRLGVAREEGAFACYNALISRVEADDNRIFEFFKRPSSFGKEDCDRILEVISGITPPKRGFFIKKEKARELLLKEPPRKIMAYLGYDSIETMVVKEDIFELYAALRFVEGAEWLNRIFFKQYECLTPNDFEERVIVVKTLSEVWRGAAEPFVQKKWHNVSHLKELGLVFVLPVMVGAAGELFRMMSMVFHYLHEIPFYSDLLRKNVETPQMFPTHLASLLRGDVREERVNVTGDKMVWFVIQRYLIKGNGNDWRLLTPHINPEAIHWERATEDIIRMGDVYPALDHTLRFWENIHWIGEYFNTEEGGEMLMSFNMVDTVMSLVQKEEMVMYSYHQQEALWNKIFMEYFGREELERRVKNYLLQGYFEV